MNADSYFAVGSTHNVCEDYALHENGERPFAVLSDGCSSSPFTDFGARYLCFAAKQVMQISGDDFRRDAVLPYACSMVGRGLPWECLDATTIALYATPGLLASQVAGDGVVVARYRDGRYRVSEYSFNNNTPVYLSYLLDSGRFNTLRAFGGGTWTIKASFWTSLFEKTGEPLVTTGEMQATTTDFWFSDFYHPEEFDLIVAFSDGVQSFQRRTEAGALESVPLPEVLRELLVFKSMRGEFVVRRCRRFLRKFCPQNGWSHYDDFSMAALYAGDE